MPNQFDSLFSDKAWDGFTRTQGTDAASTLTPFGGAPVVVVGVWEPWAEEDDFDDPGKRLVKRGIFAIDAATVVPPWTPDVRDAINIEGVDYAVDRIAQTLPVAVLHMVEWTQKRIGGNNTYKDR